ncbi:MULTISPECIES: hypothetical protein [Salinibaculum]|uniref:hypothetical protein n=1 Tax=Salinibaculum TaxID=2732368 RepID=UPI0030D2492A
MAPPSRRALLRSCGIALAGGLAGCLNDGSDQGTTPTGTRTGTPTETPTETPTGTPAADAAVGARNQAGREVSVTVTLSNGGSQVLERTRTLSDGVSGLVGDAIAAGEYTVTATLPDGTSASTEWFVADDYSGVLTAVVTDDGITFRETLRETDCSTADLPYAIPDAEETFSTSGATISNESGEAADVTLALAHDGEVFFDCTTTLSARQSLSLDGVTATAGEYTVTVDVGDGGRTEYDWRIPEAHNWPSLTVTIPRNGDPVVGCGPDGEVPVTVENPTDSDRAATLRLCRDGETVAESSVTLTGGATTDVQLPHPVGDFYTLDVTAGGTTVSEEVVYCSCYSEFETTVTLGGSEPTIESTKAVCD